MSEKKLWNIYHEHDVPDGDCYCSVHVSDHIGTVYATDEEIREYLEKWDKPEMIDECTMTGPVYEHTVRAEVLVPMDISNFGPPYVEYYTEE